MRQWTIMDLHSDCREIHFSLYLPFEKGKGRGCPQYFRPNACALSPHSLYWDKQKKETRKEEKTKAKDRHIDWTCLNGYPIAENLVNFYISVVIHSKSISYKIHVASKKQIRNKTVFFDNSVFFSFHLISFFALGNIWVSRQADLRLKHPLAKSSDFPNGYFCSQKKKTHYMVQWRQDNAKIQHSIIRQSHFPA